MKKINVFTAYDTNKAVIGTVIPFEKKGELCISKTVYNKLLRKRTIGGEAGLIFDSEQKIYVYDEKYDTIN